MATDGLSGLVDELRAGGEVDSQGRFTLDRAQARAKMQKFQLADPRRYVLELVQAAVLREATAITFDIDADDMRMRFNGRLFTAGEFDDLWGSIFADGDGRELRGLRQLALGLNAALGLGPKHIVVRSGNQQLRLVPGKDDVIEKLEPPIAETTIHVEQPVRFGLIVAFFRDLRGKLAEEVYLRERCAYSPVPITLDGKLIVRGMQVEGAIAEQSFDAPGVRGVIAMVEAERPAELRLLKDGVWIDTHALDECGKGIVAVVEADRLRKDVSMAKIVADEGLSQVMGLARVERWGLMARLVDLAARDEFASASILARVRKEALNFLKLRDLRVRPDAMHVARALHWPDARGDGPAVSLAELFEATKVAPSGEQRELRVAYHEYTLLSVVDPPIPRLRQEESASFERMLGCALIRIDVQLEKLSTRERARREWLKRELSPRLPNNREYLARAPIEGPGLRGEVGFTSDALTVAGLEGTIWLIGQGRLLTSLALPWGAPGLEAAVEAEFTPAELFDDAARDASFVRAILAVLAAMAGPLATIGGQKYDEQREVGARGLIKAWLTLMLDAQERATLWQQLGVPSAARPDEAAVRAFLPSAAVLREEPRYAVFMRLPLFRDLDETRRSLAELIARCAEVGALDEVDLRNAPEPALGRGIAQLGKGDRKIVVGMLGESALRSWLPTLTRLRRERKFREGPTTTVAEAAQRLRSEAAQTGRDPSLWCHAWQAGGVAAVLSLTPEPGGKAAITILHENRWLVTRPIALGMGTIVGTVSAPGLRATDDWNDVIEDAALEEVISTLRAGLWTLLRGLVERRAELSEGTWEWLRLQLIDQLGDCERAEFLRRMPAIGGVPLLATLAGGRASLDEVEAIVEAHQQIAWVPANMRVTDVPGPLILREEVGLLEALERWVGKERLVEGRDRVWAHGRGRKLDSLPTIVEVKLAPGAVWFTVAVSEKSGLSGEMGLSKQRSGGGLVMDLCTAGRRLGTFVHDDVPAPVEAILSDPELPLTAEGEVHTRSKRYGQHIKRCRRAAPAMIATLCDQFKKLSAEDKVQARALLLGYVARLIKPIADGAAASNGGTDAVRALPLVRDVWGEWHSLNDIEARGKPRGAIDVLTGEVELPGPGVPRERMILIVDEAARKCLSPGLQLNVLDDRWEAELKAMKALAEAPVYEQPDLREIAWVDRKATVAGGLQVHLWIPQKPSDADVLIVTRGGREVGRCAAVRGLPCAGFVSGEGMVIRAGEVELDGRQHASLAKQVCLLYDALAKQVRSGNRISGDRRERARAWLAHVDALLGASADPVLAGVGKPYDLLKETLAELIPPALRRERAREVAAEVKRERPVKVEEPKPAPKVTPAPTAAPTVAPAAPTPTPEHTLLSIIRGELEWARQRHNGLLERLQLDRLAIGTGREGGIVRFEQAIVLQARHPLVARLLRRIDEGGAPDPVDLAFVVSTIYTLMNAVADEIEAHDEQAFVARVAESLSLGLGPR